MRNGDNIADLSFNILHVRKRTGTYGFRVRRLTAERRYVTMTFIVEYFFKISVNRNKAPHCVNST